MQAVLCESVLHHTRFWYLSNMGKNFACSKFRYETFQKTNKKGAAMTWQICAGWSAPLFANNEDWCSHPYRIIHVLQPLTFARLEGLASVSAMKQACVIIISSKTHCYNKLGYLLSSLHLYTKWRQTS